MDLEHEEFPQKLLLFDRSLKLVHIRKGSKMDIHMKKQGENLWSRLLVRNWLLRKYDGEKFIADEREDTEDEPDGDCAVIQEEESDSFKLWNESPIPASPLALHNFEGKPKIQTSCRSTLMRVQSDTLWTNFIDTQELKLFVGSWNVAGKLPHEDLDLEDWIDTNEPADIYVFGFQEIVPLNAGNVFGNEDSSPGVHWDELIRKTLNHKRSQTNDRGSSAPTSLSRDRPSPGAPRDHQLLKAVTMQDLRWLTSEIANSELNGSCDNLEHKLVQQDGVNSDLIQKKCCNLSTLLSPCDTNISTIGLTKMQRPRYVRVACKQMVGIFISVWIRRQLRRHAHALRVSSVGCGIMGWLGNKGSVSVSLSLCQTSFCFICAHLSSGEKEGDELRRNSDVAEIFRRTQFPCSGKFSLMDLPQTIFAHDRIICLGDLNYRLSVSEEEMKSLIAKQEWPALLEKDQLKLEQSAGRVFVDWLEGTIDFAPTYKYIVNSNLYYGMHAKQGEKRGSPAWCDRILCYGKGLRELEYLRSELKLSDHRPVKVMFIAEVETVSDRNLNKTIPFTKTKPGMGVLLSKKVRSPEYSS